MTRPQRNERRFVFYECCSALQAALLGRTNVVRFLVSAGVDTAGKDLCGRSPADLASEAGHPALAAALRRAALSGPSRPRPPRPLAE